MDIVQRIQEVLIFSGKSVRSFALHCGIGQATLDKQLRGLRGVSLDTVNNILNSFPEISAEWLLREKGQMLLESTNENEQESKRRDKLIGVIETMQETIELKDSRIAMLNERIKQLENQLKNK